MVESLLDILTSYWFWGFVGFSIGSAVALNNIVKDKVPFPVGVLIITVGIYGGLLGARILYVLADNPVFLLRNVPVALAFWQGNLCWLGGVPGGLLAVCLVTKVVKTSFWSVTGCLAPGLALAHGISRVGCVIVGCCYGTPTTVPWAIYSRELQCMVHPTQLYSMLGEFVSFAVLQTLWREPAYRRYLFPVYYMILSAHRFVSESFRGTPPGPELVAGLRMYQSMCIFTFVAGAAVFMVLCRRRLGVVLASVLVAATATSVVLFRPGDDIEPAAATSDTHLYLVITRKLFADDLSTWQAERAGNGFNVVVGSWEDPPAPDQIRTWIGEQTRAAGGAARYILLVGDCAGNNEGEPLWHIPSVEVSSRSSEVRTDFISDAPYGDLDRDGCPEVPVGRLPVRDRSMLRTQLAKILSYRSQPIGPAWFRAVMWVGAKGYTDQMHSIALYLQTNLLPRWLDSFLISGNPNSAYSSYPPEQPEIFLEEIQKSALMTVVASHGSFRSITPTVYNSTEVFLSVEDVARLKSRHPLGPMVLLGCDSGDFATSQSKGPSLAEAFAAHPGGPIAVIAASGTTHPLTNHFAARAMIQNLTDGMATQSIGDFLLGVQRRLVRTGEPSLAQLAKQDGLAEPLLQSVPDQERGLLRSASDLVRYEALAYNLLGDPACSMRLPKPMSISITASKKGKTIVSGETATPCTQLFVQLMRPDLRTDRFAANPTETARRERFSTRNHTLINLVAKQLSNETNFTVEFDVPAGFYDNNDYIRLIAIGREHAYLALYSDKPFGQKTTTPR